MAQIISQNFCFILCTIAALAAPARPGHILMYAPGDSQACRLALAQIISQKLAALTRSGPIHRAINCAATKTATGVEWGYNLPDQLGLVVLRWHKLFRRN
ncbi:hypothetical protein C1Y42_12710 [Pantoea sp. ICBG 985]|nr:hypothetical protein C1Y42_12710 [Pantoea sp. ICBG 985]